VVGPGRPTLTRTGAVRARGTGRDTDAGGAAMDTEEIPLPAGMAVLPAGAGGEASTGSSPRSPPGKKARTAEEPLSFTDAEPLPQRPPRPAVSRREMPSSDDEEENEAEVDLREGAGRPIV